MQFENKTVERFRNNHTGVLLNNYDGDMETLRCIMVYF